MPIITNSHADTGLPAFMDHNGEVRHLGRLMRPEDHEGRKSFQPITASRYPLVPRSQWVNIDRRPQWANRRMVGNQKRTNGCVGHSAALALMRARALAGMTYQRLSGAYVYSFINGGRDEGASISAALRVLVDRGACLESTVPVEMIYRSQTKVGDAEAQRFRAVAPYTIDDSEQASAFDWAMSAIQGGALVQFAIEVGNNFESFNAAGVAGFSRGRGNHSVEGDGALEINGEWYITMPNTWDLWGPWNNGYCLLSEQHVMGPVHAGGQDAFAHLDVQSDPQDPTNPKVPAS